MATRKPKPLYKSLTVQSACLLALLIVGRAFFPEYLNDELFQTLLAVFGLGGAVGLRRALPVLLLCLVPLGLVQCGPVLCDKAEIVITNHPNMVKPAGTVTVKCDGKDKAVVVAKEVLK